MTPPRRFRMLAALAAATMLAVGAVGCGGGDQAATAGAASRPATAPARVVQVILPLEMNGADAADSVAAVKMALADEGSHHGAVDVSVATASDTGADGVTDPALSRAETIKAVANPAVIGIIGTMTSAGTLAMGPVANRSGVPIIGISATAVRLTRRSDGRPGPPTAMAPTGRANYARLVPNDIRQARAQAIYMGLEGVTDLTILDDGGVYGAALAAMVAREARGQGIRVHATEVVTPGTAGPVARAAVRALGTDPRRVPAIFIAGNDLDLSRQAVIAGASANDSVLVFGPDSMAFRGVYSGLDPAIEQRMFITTYQVPVSTYGPQGVTVYGRLRRQLGRDPSEQALYAYEAMSVLLSSIGKALPTPRVLAETTVRQQRWAVSRQLFRTVDRGSAVGTYSIDLHGDTTTDLYGAFRVENGNLVRGQALQTDASG